MKLGELIAGLPVQPAHAPPGWAELRICDVTEDSRTVMPGSLFIARRGEKSDGRQFVRQALSAGAVAVLTEGEPVAVAGAPVLTSGSIALAMAQIAERFYHAPSARLRIVGVTGTNGKTTIVHLTHQLLSASRIRCGLIGTVQVNDGFETAPASMTTPSALELSHLFSRMVDAGCAACAMEVSSHSLHQRRVGAIRFEVGVFTNLTGDHLDYHGSMEAYADAKAMLFQSLMCESVAMVNDDDPWVDRVIKSTPARIWGCTLEGSSKAAEPGREHQLVGSVIREGQTDTDVRLDGPWGSVRATVALVGRHNVMNVLQAVGAAHAVGATREQLEHALGRLTPPPGRLERVVVPGAQAPFSVVVDYAHSDDSLAKALEALRPLVAPGACLSVVFGCGGDRDRSKRPRMGAVAARLADRIVVTSDNPRTERPGAILDEILTGIPAARRTDAHVDEDRSAAIGWAIDRAGAGDIVLIAGKGHEDYQILPDGRGGTVRRHFDDREEARAALVRRFAPASEANVRGKAAGREGIGGRGGRRA